MNWIDLISLIYWATLTSLITLLWFYINSRNQKKERLYAFNKEKYFYFIKKIEIIIWWLTQMKLNVKIIKKNYKSEKNHNNMIKELINDDFKKEFINYTSLYTPDSERDILYLNIRYEYLIEIVKNNIYIDGEIEKIYSKIHSEQNKIITQLKWEIKKLEDKII